MFLAIGYLQFALLLLQPSYSNACMLTLYKFRLFPFRSPLLWEFIIVSFPQGT